MRRAVAVATAALALLAWSAAPSRAAVTGVVTTTLRGSEEVPPADPDGFGNAVVSLDTASGQVCYFLAVSNIAPSTAAHIHFAPQGVNGPIVVPLNPPTSGFSAGCTVAALPIVQNIRANANQYYVNIHNAQYPGGAVRGQLRLQ